MVGRSEYTHCTHRQLCLYSELTSDLDVIQRVTHEAFKTGWPSCKRQPDTQREEVREEKAPTTINPRQHWPPCQEGQEKTMKPLPGCLSLPYPTCWVGQIVGMLLHCLLRLLALWIRHSFGIQFLALSTGSQKWWVAWTSFPAHFIFHHIHKRLRQRNHNSQAHKFQPCTSVL